MGKHTRKYLLYMFGNWKTQQINKDMVNNIKDVMETIIYGDEFSFVTGDNVIIMCLKSQMSFEEIEDILHEFLNDNISAFFIMPKPRKLGYRLEKNLESHLFNPKEIKHKKLKKKISPELSEALTAQLKSLVDSRLKLIRSVLENPHQVKPTQKMIVQSFTLDSLLDKINDTGIESLTESELEFLNKYNEKD